MSDPGTRSGRLISIVMILQSRGTATARQLAEHLGVSLRTVYRDVDVLDRIGIPVYAETGRAGGYRLVEGYRSSLTGLNAQEALALFLIGLPAPAASLGLAEPVRAAEAKVLASLSHTHRERAGRLRDRFLLDLPRWYQDAERPAVLPDLADAVLTDQRVRVRYRRWDEPRVVRRVLEPHGLVIKNGVWYLAASGGGRVRTYRVSNILDLDRTGDSFERHPGFDLEKFWRQHLADFDARRFTDVADIRMSPALIARLDDVGDASLRAAAESGRIDDTGWTLARLPIESPGWAAAQLVRYAGELEVVRPPEVRQALRSLAESVLDRHRESVEG